jgi:hypothetical protein
MFKVNIKKTKQIAPSDAVMETILTWIGFEQEATRVRLVDEGFESFADILAMKEKDVRELAGGLLRSTHHRRRTSHLRIAKTR